MACAICEKIKNRKNKIFEDDKVVAFLNDNPAGIGHLILTTKNHHPIIENISDDDVNHIFQVANKLSTITFETLNAQGTNILVNNGIAAGQDVPHFMVHIIPRRDNDNINLSWQPKQLPPEELTKVEELIKQKFAEEKAKKDAQPKVIGKVTDVSTGTPSPSESTNVSSAGQDPTGDGSSKKDDDDDNYLLKSLRRIP